VKLWSGHTHWLWAVGQPRPGGIVRRPRAAAGPSNQPAGGRGQAGGSSARPAIIRRGRIPYSIGDHRRPPAPANSMIAPWVGIPALAAPICAFSPRPLRDHGHSSTEWRQKIAIWVGNSAGRAPRDALGQ
jgi:hypothetical protein